MDHQLVINTLWVLICTALVFLMQAGFYCLESGLCRSKNSITVAIKLIEMVSDYTSAKVSNSISVDVKD